MSFTSMHNDYLDPDIHLYGEVPDVGGPCDDPVNHPAHYTDNPKGIELIDMIGHLSFPKGAAIKYIYRAGKKGSPEKELEDLKKARWFIDYLIKEIENCH